MSVRGFRVGFGVGAALVGGVGLTSISYGALPSYRNAVLADNPIVYYEMDETTGFSAADTASANGGANTGTYRNDGANLQGLTLGAASAAPGLGTAVDFTGGNIRIPDNAAFDLGLGAYTIEFWFNPDGTARGDVFTYKGGGGDLGIHWSGNTAQRVHLYHDGFDAISDTNLATGQFYHVAITRASAGGALTIYVNGAVAGSGTAGAADTLNIANDLLIGSNFGANIDTPAITFDGRIDEVAIYGTALSQARVQAHIAAVPEPAATGLLVAAAATALARRRRTQTR